jgi:hypothetical protein
MWPRRIDPSETAREREIALVAASLSAAASLIVLAALSVDWYRHAVFCEGLNCPAVGRTGWQSLGAASVILAVAACAGVLPLIAALARHGYRLLSGVAVICALGAALLILYRIAVVPGTAAPVHTERMAGPFIALFGALALAGASSIAGLGDRFFDRGSEPRIAAAVVAAAAAVMIAALYLDWVRRAGSALIAATGSDSTQNAWKMMPTTAVIVLLGCVAIIAAAGLVAQIEWRASLLVLGFGGWLVAAIAVVVTPLETEVSGPLGPKPGIAAYEPGYYVCLAAASIIVLVGVCSAVADGAPFSRYSSR